VDDSLNHQSKAVHVGGAWRPTVGRLTRISYRFINSAPEGELRTTTIARPRLKKIVSIAKLNRVSKRRFGVGDHMETCFVIQPFDGGKFDKRYEDVFVPAISATGLEAYRVDRDPNVTIPIEDIQAGIEAAAVCLADISTDNPNVWFELGYAIAGRREVVLVCSEERKTPFPFDVQHRSIIRYSSESPRDFTQLQEKIKTRIAAILRRRDRLEDVAQLQSVAILQGLEQHEVATLISVAEGIDDPTDGLSTYRIRSAMESAGFTKIATTLGLKTLLDAGMLEMFVDRDYNGEEFKAYKVTTKGMAWLHENRSQLTLKREEYSLPEESGDIPF